MTVHLLEFPEGMLWMGSAYFKTRAPGCAYIFCFSLFFFSIPFIFALSFSLPPCRNSDPGSHSRLFSPPTHYGSCLAFFSREDFSSSLVDSCRIVLTHARRSQQFILFLFLFFLQINSKYRHGTHGPTLLIVAFEGHH